jgi:hypothetical protein
LYEAGGFELEDENSKRLAAIEEEISNQRNLFGELQKKRTRREIEAVDYNNESCVIQGRLEELFAEFDALMDERGAEQLDSAMQEMFEDFFSAAKEQAGFDKEVFTRLVKSVRIFAKDNIVFEFRNGTTIKGDTAEDIAA